MTCKGALRCKQTVDTARRTPLQLPRGTLFRHPSGSQKGEFVNRIKNYQCGGPSQKERWWRDADQFVDGIHDPAGHDVETLEALCEANGVP